MKLIPTGVTRTAARTVLKAKADSPRLFFAAGIVGVVTGGVMACRATLKLHHVTEDLKKDIYQIKAAHGFQDQLQITDEETSRYELELTKAYLHGAYRLTRLYGPAIIVTGASVGLLTGSHVTLSRRNAALTAAYAAVSESYEKYRDRVRAELGDEKELHLHNGVEVCEIEGPEGKKVKALVKTVDGYSPYARFFDEACRAWQKNPELNRLFVQAQQAYANNMLHSRGHVFLNEVYDMLGIDRTTEGSIVGWVLGEDGDNFIDYGIFEVHNSDHIQGLEPTILLDFNVDGVIYDKI